MSEPRKTISVRNNNRETIQNTEEINQNLPVGAGAGSTVLEKQNICRELELNPELLVLLATVLDLRHKKE